MLVIPAIDIIGGEAVRLTQGNYSQKTVYDSNPVSVAQKFEEFGAQWIHIVDLDGAKVGEPINLQIVEDICKKTKLKVEFGGGIRTKSNIASVLCTGVSRIILGSRLVQNFDDLGDLFLEYDQSLVAGIDMKDGFVATHGWETTSQVKGIELGKQLELLGCQRFIVTDIATDGMLKGPNLNIIKEWVDELQVPIIASGGVANHDHLLQLKSTGCEAAIVGKAIYEGKVKLEMLWFA